MGGGRSERVSRSTEAGDWSDVMSPGMPEASGSERGRHTFSPAVSGKH